MTEAPSPLAPTPPRSMRRANRAVRDPAEILGIIERCCTVRLGLRDAQGPFVVPMNFGYDWTSAPGTANAKAAGTGAGGVGAKASETGHTVVGATGTAPTEAPRLTLWLHCAGEGRKLDALEADPLVAFEMDVEMGVIEGDFSCAYSFAYESVMGTGLVRHASNAEEKLHGLERLMEHLAPGRPVRFSPAAVERVTVLAIEVLELSAKRREA